MATNKKVVEIYKTKSFTSLVIYNAIFIVLAVFLLLPSYNVGTDAGLANGVFFVALSIAYGYPLALVTIYALIKYLLNKKYTRKSMFIAILFILIYISTLVWYTVQYNPFSVISVDNFIYGITNN